MKINAHANATMFLVYMDWVGYPVFFQASLVQIMKITTHMNGAMFFCTSRLDTHEVYEIG
jgi:hypothetical protein